MNHNHPQASAIAATLGIGALGVGSTYYRFWMHMQDGTPFPWCAGDGWGGGCALPLSLNPAVQRRHCMRAAVCQKSSVNSKQLMSNSHPCRVDMAATLALVLGGVVGMEMWARYAHKALW